MIEKSEARPAVVISNDHRKSYVDSLPLRSASTMTAIAAVLALPTFALANPTGGVVIDGAATISSSGSVTNVTQATNRAIINWQGFSIGAGETVNFLQPTAMSVTLNRVVGNEQSVISGALNANGRVFLVNSAGILFGKDAQVNVGGLVASTLDISNSNFMAGNYVFSGSSNASVVNQGKIKASDGGYVALLGKTVSNEGTITARLGTIALASGEQITLNFGGDALVDVTIDKGTYDALVQNKGLIKANGGQVVLTAKAADDLLSAQVNNSGIIKARTLADLTGGSSSSGGSVKVGRIKLLASGGTVNVSGKLDASARKGGDGGTIETSGNKVTVADSAVVTTASTSGTTGSWIIDPDGFTIGIGGDITGTALTSQLASNNVTIQSTSGHGADGNIYVNDAVSWSGNRLMLTATNNVFIDAAMTATGTASFAANYGVGTNVDGTPKGLYTYQGATNGVFAGKLDFSSTGTFTLNGANYTVITTVAGLDAVRNDLAGNYVLGADLSGLRARNWSGPLGATTAFTGNFNGLGHTVISPQLTGSGLFATIGAGGLVSNFGVASATINAGTTSSAAAGLLANVNQGSIVNSFSSGNVIPRASGNPTVTIDSVGGLVGVNSGLIAQSYSLTNVAVTSIGGGLVGTNEASGAIIDSSARAMNSGSSTQVITNTAFGASNLSFVGGLVGVNARDDRSLLCRQSDKTVQRRHDIDRGRIRRQECWNHRSVLFLYRIFLHRQFLQRGATSRRLRRAKHRNHHQRLCNVSHRDQCVVQLERWLRLYELRDDQQRLCDLLFARRRVVAIWFRRRQHRRHDHQRLLVFERFPGDRQFLSKEPDRRPGAQLRELCWFRRGHLGGFEIRLSHSRKSSDLRQHQRHPHLWRRHFDDKDAVAVGAGLAGRRRVGLFEG